MQAKCDCDSGYLKVDVTIFRFQLLAFVKASNRAFWYQCGLIRKATGGVCLSLRVEIEIGLLPSVGFGLWLAQLHAIPRQDMACWSKV
jgi:hypothetical protein